MNSLRLNPAQLDRLALFVEACAEMASQPFFNVRPQPSVLIDQGPKRVTYTLGSGIEFRAAFYPFLRVWMKSSPAHWEEVGKILVEAGLPGQEHFSAVEELTAIRREISRGDDLRKLELPAGRLIDLWVETMLVPTEGGEGFSQHYDEALQRDPDVVFAHAAVARLLRAQAGGTPQK